MTGGGEGASRCGGDEERRDDKREREREKEKEREREREKKKKKKKTHDLMNIFRTPSHTKKRRKKKHAARRQCIKYTVDPEKR